MQFNSAKLICFSITSEQIVHELLSQISCGIDIRQNSQIRVYWITIENAVEVINSFGLFELSDWIAMPLCTFLCQYVVSSIPTLKSSILRDRVQTHLLARLYSVLEKCVFVTAYYTAVYANQFSISLALPLSSNSHQKLEQFSSQIIISHVKYSCCHCLYCSRIYTQPVVTLICLKLLMCVFILPIPCCLDEYLS